MTYPTRFVGTGHWIDQLPEQFPGIESSAQRFFTDGFVGILRAESDLVLECTFHGQHYTVQLARSASGVFTGKFSASEAGRSWRGRFAVRG